MLKLTLLEKDWPLKRPFKIARYTRNSFPSLYVSLSDKDGNIGQGEAIGIPYKGETPVTMAEQLEAVREQIEHGANLDEIQQLLPAGGARNALDAARWDLNAKISGIPAWKTAGLSTIKSAPTAETIGVRSLDQYRESALALADCPAIKMKATGHNDIAALQIIRGAAPNPQLIVDANEAWTGKMLEDFMPALLDLRVDIIEQPLPAGDDDFLVSFDSPIPLCADESFQSRASLNEVLGKYGFVNIKLDKTGGLTEALATSNAAQNLGLKLMVGCMGGSSLAVAPAMIIAQACEFVDLDGPLLQSADHEPPLNIKKHIIEFPAPSLWG